MMKWANFLHIYQPAGQQPDILKAVADQSYRPILEGVRDNKNIRLTFNVSGALLELLDKNKFHDLIDILRQVAGEERLEFTGSAKYHAFLPFLSDEEIVRQIETNNDSLAYFLGKENKPKGFFPPEMGYDPKLAPIISSLGFDWIVLDEIACTGTSGEVDYNKVYKIKNSNLNVFFRERRLSNLIMSAVVRSPGTLNEAMSKEIKSGHYLLTAMDGETFGHHRPGLEKMLLDIFSSRDFEFIKISDIKKYYHEIIEIEPVKSTWASSKEDIDRGIQFLSWSDPENPVHLWQKQFYDLTLQEVNKISKDNPRWQLLRQKMDMASSSDHFWWASGKPWWSLEMIELGAFRLLDTIHHLPEVPKNVLEKALSYYEKIITTSFNWQRTGKIREMMAEQKSILRIPFKDRTIGRGGAEEGVYWAFIEMMKDLEKKAAEKGEYEKAILWRDALYKLENKLDIYDTINAIDLLRIEIPHDDVEVVIEKYKEKYRKIRGGQPEQRGS